jgi:hypothetical protein
MRFSRFFKRHKEEPQPLRGKPEATIPQGIYYLYMIIGLQVAFVFGLLCIIMLIGKVISTPGWVFLALFVLSVGSLVYIYRRAKRQFQRLKESLRSADLSKNSYEISLMGGMLTMRIEQNPNAPKLLQAPSEPATEPIIDAETIEPARDHKPAHLS